MEKIMYFKKPVEKVNGNSNNCKLTKTKVLYYIYISEYLFIFNS